MVITICGSTKFKDKMFELARDLTLNGDVVLMPQIFEHADNEELTIEQKLVLDNIHYQKILMSDAILVVNIDQYIGESTWAEIDWANRLNKKIYFLEEPPKPEGEEATEEAPAEEKVSE